MKRITILFVLFIATNVYAQDSCKLNKSTNYPDLYELNTKNIICTAKEQPQNKTLLLTFGIWCAPCVYNLYRTLILQKEYKVDIYVVLIEKNVKNNKLILKSIDYIKRTDSIKTKIAILDSSYTGGQNKRYEKFLTEITPKNIQTEFGMSKHILINTKGEVEAITDWKDRIEGETWKDDSGTVNRKIIPLLEKKE